MGWISRLFTASELDRARIAAEESRDRTDAEARNFERWLGAVAAEDRTTKAAAQDHLRSAATAAEKGDLPGWLEARQQFELARAAYHRGRSALALAHPRKAAALLLADAAEGAAQLRDHEERSARAAAVVEMQAYCGDVQGARRTLEVVSEPADRASAERALAIERATSEVLDSARVARELAAADSDDWNHEEILLAIVENKCRRGDVAGAQSMLAPIDDPELKARAWRSVAQAEARAGRLAEARAIATRIEDPQWSAAAWSDFALAQAMHGDMQGALETAEGIQDESARATTMGALAGALAEAGNDAKAAELLERIEDPHERDDALTWVAEARVKKGDFTGALAMIEEVQDKTIQAQELVTLAEAAQAAGQREMASDLLRQALVSVETLRNRSSPISLARFIVEARSRLGEFDGAEAVVQVIDEERQRAELLGGLSFHLARQSGGGLVQIEGLLDRHPGLLERIAIQEHGAKGLLVLAQAQPVKSTPESAAPQESSGTP